MDPLRGVQHATCPPDRLSPGVLTQGQAERLEPLCGYDRRVDLGGSDSQPDRGRAPAATEILQCAGLSGLLAAVLAATSAGRRNVDNIGIIVHDQQTGSGS